MRTKRIRILPLRYIQLSRVRIYMGLCTAAGWINLLRSNAAQLPHAVLHAGMSIYVRKKQIRRQDATPLIGHM